MQQIQEAWAHIQNAAAASAAANPAPQPAAAQPGSPARVQNQPASAPVASNVVPPGAVTPAPAASGGAATQQNSMSQMQGQPQAEFVDRGRYEVQTSSAQQLDVSLQGLFEPTAYLENDDTDAPTASLPGLETTSFEPENLKVQAPAAAQNAVAQTALCVDCGVAYVAGQCPSCGSAAR